MIKILYLYFYKNSKLILSNKKYQIHKIYFFSKNVNIANVDCDYDIIILGGGKKGLPLATDAYKYNPNLYNFFSRCENTPILGVCYGMEILYHYYYNSKLKKLKKRNVNMTDVNIDKRFKESQLGKKIKNVQFNHKYYCHDIDKGIISSLQYYDKDEIINIPSFVKFNKKHYGIQFHIKNSQEYDKLLAVITQ